MARQDVIDLEGVANVTPRHDTTAVPGDHCSAKRRRDAPSHVADSGDVGPVAYQRRHDRVTRQRRAVATGTGPTPAISQVSPAWVSPRTKAE